jgi:dTMP kinase
VSNNQQTTGPGILITFEGGEGAGKTTHITFLASCLRAMGREVLCLREPGGTSIGESIRSLVLDPENSNMSDQAELLLYEAARAQIVKEVLIPALSRGAVVLLDRFYDSTIAYQVYGRGLPEDFVRQANGFACQGVHPCRTILLTTDSSAEEGLLRATHHGDADRLELEGADFHTRVNQAFFRIAAENPERVRVVSSSGPKDETARNIFMELKDVFGWSESSDILKPEFFKAINERSTDHKAQISDGV